MKLANLTFALTTALCTAGLSACVGADQTVDEGEESQEAFIVNGKILPSGFCPTTPEEWSASPAYPRPQLSIGITLRDTGEFFVDMSQDDDRKNVPVARVAAILLNLQAGANISDEVLEATVALDEWIVDVELGGDTPLPEDANAVVVDYFNNLRPCYQIPEVAVEASEDHNAGDDIASTHPALDADELAQIVEQGPDINSAE